MRAVFGIVLILGGLWLCWLVLTGLPFPWEDPNAKSTTTPTPASTSSSPNTQASTVAGAGASTPGTELVTGNIAAV